MASINGVPLNLTDIKIKNTHNNVYSDIPGVAGGSIYDMGYSGLTIEISGWELTDGAYRSVLKELMRTGENSFVIFAGWEYRVYGGSVNRSMGTTANYYPWSVSLKTEDPFEYSLYPNSRIKVITTNPQSWTADDSGNTITNEQNASTPVDVEVYGHTNADSIMTEKVYTHTYTDNVTYPESTTSYVLKYTRTWTAKEARRLHLTNVSGYVAGFNERASASCQVRTYSAATGETVIATWDVEWGAAQAYYPFSTDVDIYFDEGVDFEVRYYLASGSSGYVVNIKNLSSTVSQCRHKSTLGVAVYNNAAPTTVAQVCNRLSSYSRLRINTDGSGEFQYHRSLDTDDTWTDECYMISHATHVNGVHITNNDYVVWDFDTKYAMTGNVTLTLNLIKVSGAIFIYTALDDGTGNPGSFTLVDSITSEYSSTSINLAGQTKFYIRLMGSGSTDITLTYINVSVAISPLTAVFPVIVGDGVTNTFTATQTTGTGIYCSVLLWYEERRWG